jgi:hypothetical protein
MLGCSPLQGWHMLERTSTGVKVVHAGNSLLTIGDMATINYNRHGCLLTRPKKALHTIRMDIGYGKGTSPGGHKYALTFVDLATHHVWVYGVCTKNAKSVIDALWSFFIDAGGIPKKMRCNFDSSIQRQSICLSLPKRRPSWRLSTRLTVPERGSITPMVHGPIYGKGASG